MFFYAGYIEKWGGGTLKIINECRRAGLPDPDFIDEGVRILRVIFRKDILTEEYLRKMGVNERQIKAVMYVKERGKITNKEHQELTNVSRQMATLDLARLVDKGVFIRIGKAGKGIVYQLTNK